MSAQTLSQERPFTAEDLERLSAQGFRYELLRGELIEMSPAGFPHGAFTLRLIGPASAYVYANNLGECTAAETGFKVAQDPDTVLAPDWAFVAQDRLPEGWENAGFLALAPDLVLETRSPGDTKRALRDKAKEWINAGVLIVWTLDVTARTLTVYRKGREPQTLGPEDTLTGEEALPGFTYPLSRLFR